MLGGTSAGAAELGESAAMLGNGRAGLAASGPAALPEYVATSLLA